MPESSERSIFFQALEEESPDARAAFLTQACGGNEQLRSSVERLLQAHDRPDNLLDEPVAVLDAGLLPESQPLAEMPGTSIGPYKLMEQIGEGGFGLVFVAEQQQPVRRKVALKVIKPGMDTRDVVARFEAERQALALMNHPNIASVFDAGATSTGRPYFVMELVRGVPMTRFCDHQQLDTKERLQLFTTVCHAVQHAHQKGVIHRDLKPSNVLVTLHDGKPVAKVIDFGVAKAIGQSLTNKTIYTRFTAMIGTPAYMSPEQAEMSGLDVDTRSDIYSLGVLLYELLTGSTPFAQQRLASAGLDEVRRIIREEEPPKPSTRLSTLGQTLSTVSANRRVEASRLPALVRGDLDWIVMKAIEKDRSRRYETAAALAADVQRFLADEPVEARPPSQLYRFSKFARRHKVTIATVSLVAAALILGTVISVWQAAVAVDERNEKERALDDAVRARNEAHEARKHVEEFAERLKQANLLVTSGRAHADEGRWSTAHLEYTRATELQPSYYLVWVDRGSLYVRLGLWKRAAADFSQAIDLGAPADGPSWSGVPQLLFYTGDEQRYRKMCRDLQGDLDGSGAPLNWSALRSSLLTPVPQRDPLLLAEQAEMLLNPAPLGGPDRGFGPQPGRRGRPGDRRPWGVTLYVAGWAHYRAGDYQRAIDRLEQAHTQDPNWPGREIVHPLLAMANHRAGRGDEAQAALATADQWLDRWTTEMAEGQVGTMPLPWFDWIEFLVLNREATILIAGYAPADDVRLRTIQQRALAATQSSDTTGLP